MAPQHEKVEEKHLQDAEAGDIDDIELQKTTRKLLWKLDTRYDHHLTSISFAY